MTDLLRCERLVIGHRGRPLAKAFDLSVRAGELVLVVGPNGAGKTTWLRTVLGLLAPVSGSVRRRTPPPRTSYVPQAASLDPALPVRGQDVTGWGRLRGWSFLNPVQSHADRAARDTALAGVGADGFERLPFRDLSGGQRQRVLFARVLASDAELLLLDEPTASMDTAAARATYRRLAALAHEDGRGVVVVSHALDEVGSLADVVLSLTGDGVEVRGHV